MRTPGTMSNVGVLSAAEANSIHCRFYLSVCCFSGLGLVSKIFPPRKKNTLRASLAF